MTGRLRALGRDLAVYGLGEIAVKAFGFVTLPVYTRLLVPADYGLAGYLSTVVGLASAILILGGDSAYARFFYAASTTEERRRITTTWISFLGAFSCVGIALLAPFSGAIAAAAFDSPDQGPLVLVAIAAVPILIVNRMCGQVLRNQFRPGAFTVLNIGSVTLSVALALICVAVLELGVTGLFLGTLIAEVVLLPIRLLVVRDMFGLTFSAAILRRLLSFGLPLVPMSIAYWIFLTSDRIVLAQLSTLEQVGLYSVAATLVAVPSVAISAVSQAWSPHAISAYEEDPEGARHLVARIGVYVLTGFGLLSVGITAFAPELLRVLSTGRYAPAADAVAPLALAMVAQASTTVTALGISLVKRTTVLAVLAWVAAGVNAALNLVLDGPFGMVGAAWATTAAYVALTVGYHLVSQRLWHVPYPGREAVLAIAATVIFTLSAPLLPTTELAVAVAVKALYCLAFVAVLIGLRVVDVWVLVTAVRSRRAVSIEGRGHAD